MDRIGRYKIVKELGRGAMGVVYEAVDPTIGRTIAIKTIRLREVDDLAQRARLKERLFREAQSAGVLSHPGIVTIYDMKEDDGVAYIVMQFVNGPTLDDVMSASKPMGAKEMFRVLRQTAAALDFAHQKGIVHRDIKPANIMIDEDGTVKIADFGIAKTGTSGNLTLSGAILGTPNYMSPEQVQGGMVDGRSDQFSLAVVAYEILTGERPFAGEHLGTVVYKIVAEAPPAPHFLNPSLTPEIDTVLERALAKKANNRYVSCTEFVTSLEAACGQSEGWKSLARGASHSLTTEAGPRETTPQPAARPAKAAAKSEPMPRPRARKPAEKPKPKSMFLPAAAAFAVVLGALGLIAWQAGVWPQQAPAETPKTEVKKEEPVAAPADVETPPPQPAPTPLPVETPSPEKELPKPAPAKPTVTKPPVNRQQVQSVAAKVPVAIPPKPAAIPQDIYVQTNPPGATAILDSRPASACQTPCMILAEPGKHRLLLSLANHQQEVRQVEVGDAREDVPLVSMRPNGGTLMVTSIPPGANIFIDDRLQTQMTPAQFNLTPGSYKVLVERDGVRKEQQIEIRNGNTNYLRLPLRP